MKFYREVDGEIEFFTGNVLNYEGHSILSPTEEQMIEAGWSVYTEPEPSDAEKLAAAKAEKLVQIENYDSSSAVEQFTINDVPMWLGHELRQQIRTSADAYEALGYETMTKIFNGAEFTFPIVAWRQMLNALEVYAAEALNTTETHKANVMRLEDIQEVLNYDYTVGYPSKLEF